MSREFSMPSRWAERPIKIILIGAGGTGSDLIVRLAKLHRQLIALDSPGLDVTVYDPDYVSETNVGRQHFSPSSIGLNKAIALVHSVNLAYSLSWQSIPRTFDVQNIEPMRGTDIVITAVDKASFRAELATAFHHWSSSTLWLDTGNGSDSGNVVLGHLGYRGEGEKRLPNVFDLWPELGAMQAADDDAPSCSAEESIQRQSWPVNQTASLLAAEILWTLIRTGRLEYHGYTFSLRPMTTSPMSIDPQAWSFFGYVEAA